MAGEERIDDRYLVATVFEILLQWPMINGGGFHDHCNLIFGTVAYVKETGDFSILDEPVPFDNKAGTEVSLMEHLKISFNHVVENLGPHMLPLIGRADWNDCLCEFGSLEVPEE